MWNTKQIFFKKNPQQSLSAIPRTKHEKYTFIVYFPSNIIIEEMHLPPLCFETKAQNLTVSLYWINDVLSRSFIQYVWNW